MGARTTPDSPSADPNCNDPVKKTKTDCKDEKKCWVDDYEKKISIESYSRYFKQYKPDGTLMSYSFPKTYKILAPVKTGDKITVEVRFKVEKQASVTDADVTTAKANLEKGINTYWNNQFTLEADDPECGKKSFKVEYKAIWVDSGHDYTMKVHDTYAREGLTGKVLDVSKTTGDWTYAHEFAHTVGTPDEYSYTTDTETVKYVKPDGTEDSGVSAPPFKDKSAADATIMSSHSNTTVLKRHGWNIAIETQELLTAKLGRKIKCDIK